MWSSCGLRTSRAASGRLPGKPAAHNYQLRSINFRLLWGIVACHFKLLGCPGIYPPSPEGVHAASRQEQPRVMSKRRTDLLLNFQTYACLLAFDTTEDSKATFWID